jgi:putative membrane protein
MTDSRTRRKYLAVLGSSFGAVALWAAIAPRDRGVWALENSLTVVAVALLVLTYRKLPLSRVSYTLIALFLCLHEIGSHYVYAHVPYDAWSQSLLGVSIDELFGWNRNQYDRFVHFGYGLLLAYPIREVFLRVADAKGFWGYFLPLDLTMSTSMLYELLEWLAAIVFGESTEISYLGTQGDSWDANKDMLLASVGALIAMVSTALVNRRLQHDFAREWWRSLKVRHPRPAGEDAIERVRYPGSVRRYASGVPAGDLPGPADRR